MLFGIGNRSEPEGKRNGLLGGGLRSAALVGAGMLTLRWWRNRKSSQTPRGNESVGRNPVHGWQ